MKTLDRYVIREILPPFLIAILVFTFILIIPFIIELAEQMIAKGVPWPMLLRLMVTLLPSALALTIPMSLLIGILVAFGRLSADREFVVMMACGISPYRLLRPLARARPGVAGRATSWVLLKAMPDANQAFREMTMQIVDGSRRGRSPAPRLLRGLPQHGPLRPRDSAERRLAGRAGRRHVEPGAAGAVSRPHADGWWWTARPGPSRWCSRTARATPPSWMTRTAYEVLRFQQMVVSLNPEVSSPGTARRAATRTDHRGAARARRLTSRRRGSPPHNPVMEIHKKFSIPVACFVFALLGLALGASNRKDGKLASFVLGIGVIFVYYVIMFMAPGDDQGRLIPAWLAMWLPNIILGVAGVALLMSRARSADQPIRISLPRLNLSRWTRSAALPAGPNAATVAAATSNAATDRVVVVIRIPQFELPRPNLLDIYVGRQYLRILAMTMVGHAGAVLHLHVPRPVGQVVQGPDDARANPRVPVVVHAAVHVLHHRAGRAARRARDDRPAHQEQRADRDAGMRGQPLPDRGADGGLRAGGQRGPVRHGRTRAGARQSARRPAEASDSRRVSRRPSTS